MPKYIVELIEHIRVPYVVDAESPEEAVRMAIEDPEVKPAQKEVERLGVCSVGAVYQAS